ncbi:ATP-dependent zinc metalloprotease FtsH [Microtetraspora sp. NBRC 13810]|uniref:ATP-dependent zinc metalloprotease FtsH n=1 Tax=Microtetraspora sp. NBRC 13810 TaxID=3030990 RepID=UPI0024A18049|nr:ATP-dependent zinc metalloprotease FtsH [Microtetraspora sp. NBRC 13810]GLW09264.1 ATP-dependent zinc metalloprotease FtsH [Microtetraspora sp. NBRC 13810]
MNAPHIHTAGPPDPGGATGRNESGGRPVPGRPTAPQPRIPWSRAWIFTLVAAFFFLVFFGPDIYAAMTTDDLTYSGFLGDLTRHAVATVSVGSSGELTGRLSTGQDYATQAPVWALNTSDLASRLTAAGVQISAHQQDDTLRRLVTSLLPTLLFLGALVWVGSRMQQVIAAGSGAMGGVFRGRSRLTEAERPSVRFDDVAGYEGVKQEVHEVVDFLQHPDRYRRAGAQGPRGVLLVGPPGTGKTLLARAVAGEARVPFFAATGSSFVEVYVGLGASRVREMFAEARTHAPSIVFIDEIDAVGARRTAAGPNKNDEREQTLNQLLAEMDGFTRDSMVVVLANTNRPEVLDAALLRPGRFDRQVQVPLPGQADRLRILDVHARDKPLACDVDLSVVSRGTPGLSGADLANLVNEAALQAARNDRDEIRAADFDEARDRLLLGRRDDSTALLPDERLTVAVHESGHAVAAALCPTADLVTKITILPVGVALGVTHQLPRDERRLYTEEYLTESLTVRLAGRAAERLVLEQSSTGAARDLSTATELAVRMVREYGLSPQLGPVAYPGGALPQANGDPLERPYAEATQRVIDAEVGRLLRRAEQCAAALLERHREALDELTRRLLDEETLDGCEVYDIVGCLPSGETVWEPMDAADDPGPSTGIAGRP